MKLLILGGTVFLGRCLVEAALAQGHDVTLFNRGRHNPELFPDVEKLRGDRDGDLAALRGRRWDAVIDTCGYVPRVVGASAGLLAGAVDHYTFISSISVYANGGRPGMDESAPVATLDDPSIEEVTGESYGPLKALSERAAEEAMPGRVLVLRPGLIVGPYDPTDRFTYWCRRIARGGEVLAPDAPQQPVQVIDVRDLAEWTLRMVDARRTGTYNVTGPAYALTFQHLLETCKAVSHSDAQVTWVGERFLLEAGVAPWSEIPLWLPAQQGEDRPGIFEVNCDKAIAAGLVFRPLDETIRDTLRWDATQPQDREPGAGLQPEREVELLQRWHGEAALRSS